MKFRYYTSACSQLPDKVWEECSELFSSHYGKYSGEGRYPKGKRIKMGPGVYKRFYKDNPDMYVSLCYEGNILLGQAFFLKKEIKGKGVCSFVTQLVVHSNYRNRKIGSQLLQSAWGFSDYFAWGLATANAITLKTLESVTWREITVEDIRDNLEALNDIIEEIPFIEKGTISLTKKQSQVFTDFFPEIESSNNKKGLNIYARKLGKLKPGNEWFAFTFQSQDMNFSQEKFDRFLDFSEKQLEEAYSRMNMPEQKWTKYTISEIDFILDHIKIGKDASIIDLGCGQGRHVIELSNRGYDNIIGIDFSLSNIQKAIETSKRPANFVQADARKLNLGVRKDLVLCLYDVIGSFRDEKDNVKILKVIKRHLKKKGYAVISVMNMELTEAIAINKCSLKQNPSALLQLPPSRTMAVSGNIFKPEYFLINTDDGIVYRKEQFLEDNELSTEYVVADKRYTMAEFESILSSVGLEVVDKRYVQAGRWETALEATNPKAKEILFIVAHAQRRK